MLIPTRNTKCGFDTLFSKREHIARESVYGRCVQPFQINVLWRAAGVRMTARVKTNSNNSLECLTYENFVQYEKASQDI